MSWRGVRLVVWRVERFGVVGRSTARGDGESSGFVWSFSGEVTLVCPVGLDR